MSAKALSERKDAKWKKRGDVEIYIIRMNENELSKVIVNLCFNIHKQYGPGLFEKVYEEIFCYEWSKTGLPIVRQKGIKVIHDGVDMGIGFIPDIIVGDKVILELKSIEMLAEVHYKQLMTYLKLTNLLLILFIKCFFIF